MVSFYAQHCARRANRTNWAKCAAYPQRIGRDASRPNRAGVRATSACPLIDPAGREFPVRPDGHASRARRARHGNGEEIGGPAGLPRVQRRGPVRIQAPLRSRNPPKRLRPSHACAAPQESPCFPRKAWPQWPCKRAVRALPHCRHLPRRQPVRERSTANCQMAGRSGCRDVVGYRHGLIRRQHQAICHVMECAKDH